MKSKIYNIFIALVLLTSISCSVQNQWNIDNVKQLEPNLQVQFYDKLDTIPSQNDLRVFTTSFIKTFTDNEEVDYSKPISLKLENDKMFLQFSDKKKKEFVLQFYGKLRKRKFVFYTNYKTITFPGLLMSKQMEMFEIYVSESNDLVFQNYHTNEGMCLFLGAGNSYKNVYRFNIIKNE